ATSVHQFATFFIARIEQDSLRMTFSNAGHNYPMVIRRGSDPKFLEGGGLVLGIQDGALYKEEGLRLDTGDLVVLYTDGISEATSRENEFYGDERLCELVRSLPHGLSAREVTERVLEALRTFLDGEEPRDDMTLMVLRVLEPEPAQRVEDARSGVMQPEAVEA